ncbi:Clan SC, family S9, unassigned serine peptidase [Histomonas meleagridis]|uniref:Clan SC, family S9, unassigned serine peptidase n=1 Tax=Histomonas meleagridis TaxID=135588 RepID=UPI00355AC1C2|nr:Clan SC, family S9, unassigned serine peptidase [Histomonas meleagridis]KAH0796332.1 Clan SC, family S9, unassigned serine peptidase [Histomonas meleagridis]
MLVNLLDYANCSAVNSVIRPPRAEYNLSRLPTRRDINGYGPVFRQGVSFENNRGQKIVGSYFAPNGDIANPPCVIYLHGNASCQLEGFFLLPIFIPFGCSVLCIDCSGSGNSDGEVISLGYFESDDVLCAIKFLRERYKVGKIALWGRSMGAATSLLTIAKDPTISAAVVDSPFASLHDLIYEIGCNLPFPKFMVKIYVNFMRFKIRKIANFNIDDVEPIKYSPNSTVPLFLIHGANDTFINCKHSRRIYEAYSGEKHIEIVPGNHNSIRPQDVMILAILHIANQLGIQIDIEAIPPIEEEDNANYHFENAMDMGASRGNNNKEQLHEVLVKSEEID